MTMAETSEEAESQTLEGSIPSPLLPSKRKPDAEFPEEGEGEPEKKLKHQKPEIASGPVPQPQDAANSEDGQNEETMADPNGAVKRKGALTAVDKGKGILVEEEEEEDDDSDGRDESSGGDSDDAVGGEEDDDSDFVDDPLAEIDLDNILPSRTRRREPPPPGSYFDPDQGGDDSDDSE
ncbi:histone H2A.Z-specific chaperone CHZ1-like [Zingiber officinale]|uniref:Histone chaperone domain-containing protein n=1 Tax=Zingiber officinale TaxID=94328 RepID=A0A8J5FE40_ZINOF|nr:histone H2A.Z-specific chaperone CHZ1-like [Zingiber officinale]XP_042419565.1 histone H2A.Z-specific chaperone CHZ1-like [Zingiber officinale]XP_042419566.1 histone H2A.Z-specific chaperone CHZ1-like [Zingiber officinale]XP_042419567.1 histone H2A.Z-specific chaperone CHZ1-like [Zingiber officinale]KAG6485592.1 hypothetical protein ZIOFF_054155 [Zingiber officinale]